MVKLLTLHFGRKSYLFKIKWGFSFFCLFLFILCIGLGQWQLHRYEYKKTLLSTYEKRMQEVPQDFNQVMSQPDLQFRSVKIAGQYVNSLMILVQNRFYNDQLGFEVLTPIKMPGDKKLLLIDRGWVKKPETQLQPDIQPVLKKQEITGHIKLLDEYQFILGDNLLQPEKKPYVVQRLDINELSQITHEQFYPFILRLDANQENGFVRDWTIVTVMPARHMAYAVQWFALALVLLIAYSCFCFEKVIKRE